MIPLFPLFFFFFFLKRCELFAMLCVDDHKLVK